MDGFALLMDALSLLVGHGVMHLLFISRLTGRRLRGWHFALYFLLLGAIQLVSERLSFGGILPVGAGVAALCGLGRFGMGSQRPVSWLSAVLAYCVSQLSFGIINSVEAAFFPRFIGDPLLYPLLLAAQLLFLLPWAGCYHAVLKLLAWTEGSQTPYIGLLLFPGLFFFAAELYILQTAYSFFDPTVSLEEVGRHGALLLLQVMGLVVLVVVLLVLWVILDGMRYRTYRRRYYGPTVIGIPRPVYYPVFWGRPRRPRRPPPPPPRGPGGFGGGSFGGFSGGSFGGSVSRGGRPGGFGGGSFGGSASRGGRRR